MLGIGTPSTVFHELWKESEQQVAGLLGLDASGLIGFLSCAVDGILLHRIYEPQNCSFRDHASLHASLLVDKVRLYLTHRSSLRSLNR